MNCLEPAADAIAAKLGFTEHYVSRGRGRVYARLYAGEGPAFVLMHGFPDNLRIYDDLIPYLVAAGRRVVTFDFQGFGASDKPAGAIYSFQQQREDLEAVVESLDLGIIIPVAHDSSGFASVDYTLANADRVAKLIMLNSAYAEDTAVLWPELITLFATDSLGALAMAMARTPAQFGWLLAWQQTRFVEAIPQSKRSHFEAVLGPLIGANFLNEPSAGPAFVQLTGQFFAAQAENNRRVAELKTLDVPVQLIWGEFDPYITIAVAERRQSQFKDASLTVVPAGHWLQIDMPEAVAQAMLS